MVNKVHQLHILHFLLNNVITELWSITADGKKHKMNDSCNWRSKQTASSKIWMNVWIVTIDWDSRVSNSLSKQKREVWNVNGIYILIMFLLKQTAGSISKTGSQDPSGLRYSFPWCTQVQESSSAKIISHTDCQNGEYVKLKTLLYFMLAFIICPMVIQFEAWQKHNTY